MDPVYDVISLWVRSGPPREWALCQLLCLMHDWGAKILNVVKSHVS